MNIHGTKCLSNILCVFSKTKTNKHLDQVPGTTLNIPVPGTVHASTCSSLVAASASELARELVVELHFHIQVPVSIYVVLVYVCR